VGDLRNRITAAVARNDRDTLTRVWNEMHYRIDICRITKGGYIELCGIRKKTCRVSLSIRLRITLIRCVVYLLRIFKMFHRLMNYLVQDKYEELHSRYVDSTACIALDCNKICDRFTACEALQIFVSLQY
jgi:hypothetical protein